MQESHVDDSIPFDIWDSVEYHMTDGCISANVLKGLLMMDHIASDHSEPFTKLLDEGWISEIDDEGMCEIQPKAKAELGWMSETSQSKDLHKDEAVSELSKMVMQCAHILEHLQYSDVDDTTIEHAVSWIQGDIMLVLDEMEDEDRTVNDDPVKAKVQDIVEMHQKSEY